MRYENYPSFDKYLEGTLPQKLSPFYLIVGKELFDCQEAIERLLSILLPQPNVRDLALTTFDGVQIEQGALSNALESGSFFVKSQVVLIHQFDKAPKSIQEMIEKILARPRQGLYVILSAGSWSKNSAFYKKIEKEGVVLDFAELKPWEKEKRFIAWVTKEATRLRKRMSYPVAQLMVKRVGHDQAILAREFDKVLCYCGERDEITTQDVEAICSKEHHETIWELGEAIFRREAAQALLIGKAFLTDGQPFLPLLRQIRSQFQTEFQVCLLLEQGKDREEISRQFPYMKGQILERHLEQARGYGLHALKRGLLAIDEAEYRSKNSMADEMILLELLLHELLKPR